jgi:hypothetical protein
MEIDFKLFFQSDSENEKEILLKSWWTEHAETEQRLPMSLTRINQHRILPQAIEFGFEVAVAARAEIN